MLPSPVQETPPEATQRDGWPRIHPNVQFEIVGSNRLSLIYGVMSCIVLLALGTLAMSIYRIAPLLGSTDDSSLAEIRYVDNKTGQFAFSFQETG